ncbi:MAG: TIGR04206 family protein [Haloferacaceae archaeon]
MTDSRSFRTRVAVLALLAALPWSIQWLDGSGLGVRFVWGMASPGPGSVSTLVAYLRFSGAPIVFDWLLAAGLFGLAVVVTLIERATGRYDGRIAAGLLALSGLANLAVAWTFSVQPGRLALPVGTLLLWYVAWRWWREGSGLLRE